MGTSELADFLEQNFSKKTYTELSASQNKSLIQSSKCEAYDFDEITEYIFLQNKPSSADAILLDRNRVYFVEFKSGFHRKMSRTNFDRTQCRCEKIDDICDDYAKLMKRNLENIESELKANLFQKTAESRWTLEYHLLPEAYKNTTHPDLQIFYIIVTDKVKEDPIDAMGQIMDDLAKIHNEDNFYERMEQSVKHLYCESRYRKKAFYDKVEVYSVQDFEMFFLD